MPTVKTKKKPVSRKVKKKEQVPPLSSTVALICPECGNDAWVPAMKIWLTKSFVGNKVTVEWPSRTGSNNHCPIICAECALAVVVTEMGDALYTKKKGLGLSEK